MDGTIGMTEEDLALLEQIQKKHIPYVIAFNKCDLCSASESQMPGMTTGTSKNGSAISICAASVFMFSALKHLSGALHQIE